MTDKIEIVFVRHGQTKGNEEGKYIGTTDEDLSSYGRECLVRLLRKDVYPRCEMYFISPRKRCRETLETIAGDVPKTIIEEFAELSFGPFENKNYGQLKHDEAYREWVDSAGEKCPEGCEKKSDFIKRNRAALLKLAQLAYEAGAKKVMLVAHAGNAMALTSSYTGCDYYENIPKNGDGYLLEATCEIKDGKVDNISQLDILRGLCS